MQERSESRLLALFSRKVPFWQKSFLVLTSLLGTFFLFSSLYSIVSKFLAWRRHIAKMKSRGEEFRLVGRQISARDIARNVLIFNNQNMFATEVSTLPPPVSSGNTEQISSNDLLLNPLQKVEAQKDFEFIKNRVTHLALEIVRETIIENCAQQLPEWKRQYGFLSLISKSFKNEEDGMTLVFMSISWMCLDACVNFTSNQYIISEEKKIAQNKVKEIESLQEEVKNLGITEKELFDKIFQYVNDLARRPVGQYHPVCEFFVPEFVSQLVAQIPTESRSQLFKLIASLLSFEEKKLREMDSTDQKDIDKENRAKLVHMYENLTRLFEGMWKLLRLTEKFFQTARLVITETPPKRERPILTSEETTHTSIPPPPVQPLRTSSNILNQSQDNQTFKGQIHRISVGSTNVIIETFISEFLAERWDKIVEENTKKFDSIKDRLIQQGFTLPEQAVNQNLIDLTAIEYDKLMFTTLEERYIITIHYVLQHISRDDLFHLVRELLGSCQPRFESLISFLLQQLVGTLLAANLKGQADRLFGAVLDPILQCYHAMRKLKKNRIKISGELIIAELGRKAHRSVPDSTDEEFIRQETQFYWMSTFSKFLKIFVPEGFVSEAYKIIDPSKRITKKDNTSSTVIWNFVKPFVEGVVRVGLVVADKKLVMDPMKRLYIDLDRMLDPLLLQSELCNFIIELVITERGASKTAAEKAEDYYLNLFWQNDEKLNKLSQQIDDIRQQMDSVQNQISGASRPLGTTKLKSRYCELAAELEEVECQRLQFLLSSFMTNKLGGESSVVASKLPAIAAEFCQLLRYKPVLKHILYSALDEFLFVLSVSKTSVEEALEGSAGYLAENNVKRDSILDYLSMDFKRDLLSKLVAILDDFETSNTTWGQTLFSVVVSVANKASTFHTVADNMWYPIELHLNKTLGHFLHFSVSEVMHILLERVETLITNKDYLRTLVQNLFETTKPPVNQES